MRIALLAALIVLAMPSTAAAGRYVPCGDALPETGGGSFDIYAKRLPCIVARAVAKRWSDQTMQSESAKRVVLRGNAYRCRSRAVGYEGAKVLCTRLRGRKAVRFSWGL